MAFFQNPFAKEFRGNLVLGDRQHSVEYLVPAHKSRGDDVVVSSAAGPFNLSGNDTDGNASNTLTIWYAYRTTTNNINQSMFDRWNSVQVRLDTTAASSSAVSHYDIINALSASVGTWTASTAYTVGSLIIPSPTNGYYYKCTTAGTSAATIPSFTSSGTFSDGSTLVWTSMGSISTAAGLNAFSSYFTAFGISQTGLGGTITTIRSTLPSTELHFYIQNGTAEELLLFNANAGVAELPAYFVRHQVTNQFAGSYPSTYYVTPSSTISPLYCTLTTDSFFAGSSFRTNFPDGANALVTLNPYDSVVNTTGKKVDLGVITRATNVPIANGVTAVLSAAAPNPDWKLLRGKSGLFTFQKIQIDNTTAQNIVQIIEYPAGAKAGDLGRITKYYRNGAVNPYQITEEPYMLNSNDLIQPMYDSPVAWNTPNG